MNIQQMIDEMVNGNTDAILAGISSKNDLIKMNAIINGVKRRITDASFIAGVQEAMDNKAILLGFPINSVAEAALYYLIEKKYTGDNSVVKLLLQNKFEI